MIHVAVFCPPLCVCLRAQFGAAAIAVCCRAATKGWQAGGDEGWMLPKGCLRGMNDSSQWEGGMAARLFLHPLASRAGCS